ncbi:multiple sugar transport system substrate-binding protein [Catenuloplanes nepalensis]|uniref:Multiple sugar transport system substrate-binding protein n=1 Tax=Catenuloplanes nepalensis TaxID=587533 RepID=A0ABT9MRY9_9ACTN|nr:extracellular solute-binding protein [Catenuloplanes nepalensis]MDP9794149.1 multiple sugar transport system substrate-binding protein [Catenuloplanes nepalensis]
MHAFHRRPAAALGAGAVALALMLTGCSGDSGDDSPAAAAPVSQEEIDKAMATPTTLTFWEANKLQPEIDLFQAKYPAIKVNLVDAGSGPDYYTKLRSAIKAGEGAPDVAQIEYHHMPSFILEDSLADLTPYGAAASKDLFAPFAWSQVATDNGIYGIPQDTGPLGLLYRTDIFDKAKVTPPATWADFAAAAAAVHQADAGQYITNISPSNASATLGLFWQAGARPFSYDGKETVSVKLNSPEMKQVAQYWQDLVTKDLVSTDPDFTDQWFQGLANGKYASWTSAAWGPVFLQGTAADTAGKWRAAELPQWTAGVKASGNVGGSANAVLKSSKNPIAAAKFAEFLNGDHASAVKLGTDVPLFPAAVSALSDPALTGNKNEFFGGQEVTKLFTEISPTVGTDFQWLPFMDPVFESYNQTFGKALTEKGSLTGALDAWQDEVVAYAKSQGFTVS